MSIRGVRRDGQEESDGQPSGQLNVSLVLAKQIRDILPLQNREDWLVLEAWLIADDDEACSVNRAQLKDYVTRVSFGVSEREYVNSTLLNLFNRKFASCYMSWAGVKGNKEFTLKTSKIWDLIQDVVSAKFPNFQKNMVTYFNNFHKDAAKPSKTLRPIVSDDPELPELISHASQDLVDTQ